MWRGGQEKEGESKKTQGAYGFDPTGLERESGKRAGLFGQCGQGFWGEHQIGGNKKSRTGDKKETTWTLNDLSWAIRETENIGARTANGETKSSVRGWVGETKVSIIAATTCRYAGKKQKKRRGVCFEARIIEKIDNGVWVEVKKGGRCWLFKEKRSDEGGKIEIDERYSTWRYQIEGIRAEENAYRFMSAQSDKCGERIAYVSYGLF